MGTPEIGKENRTTVRQVRRAADGVGGVPDQWNCGRTTRLRYFHNFSG